MVDQLHLEAHGFVSFGSLSTWEDAWLSPDTLDGSEPLTEAAINVIARPVDRVRLGVQLFSRRLGDYDDGEPQVDWAYADLTLSPACDIQAGRVKIPVGLYNEIQDIDAAHASVFLPQSVYPIRLREVIISIDGGKVGGYVDLPAGGLGYAAFAGTKHLEPDGSYAIYISQTGNRLTPTDIGIGPVYGAMLHWDTPIAGLGLRLSAYQNDDLDVEGPTAFGPAEFTSDATRGIASVEYERGHWTFASEYLYLHIDGETTIGASRRAYGFQYHGGYVNATWHGARWLELYGAVEYSHVNLIGPPPDAGWTWVGAVEVRPLTHWSLKAEYQYHLGAFGAIAADNPDGLEDRWQAVALKTTVDF